MYSKLQVIKLPPVFMMNKMDEDEILSKLSGVDVIFSQKVGDEYPIDFVRTNFLKSTFPHTISWPSIYHSGYFPDVRYIYLDGIGKLVGPLDDYHLDTVRASYVEGLGVGDCIARYEADNFLARYPDPIGASISELQNRENDIDVKISDYIADHGLIKKLFYTTNHPVRDVLFEMMRRMLHEIGADVAKPNFHPYALSKVNLSIYPAVRQLYGLSDLLSGSYVGIDRLHIDTPTDKTSTRVFEDIRDVVESFYRFYDSVPAMRG